MGWRRMNRPTASRNAMGHSTTFGGSTVSEVTTNSNVVNSGVPWCPRADRGASGAGRPALSGAAGRSPRGGQEGVGPRREGIAERQPGERSEPVLRGPARLALYQPLPQGGQGVGLRHRGTGAGSELVAGEERG